jgi:hypothetical protein
MSPTIKTVKIIVDAVVCLSMFESPVIEAMASAQQIFADFTNSKSMSIAPQNALSKKS